MKLKLPDTKTLIILVLIVAFCISGFWNVKQKLNGDLAESRKKTLELKDEYIRLLIDSIHRQDLAALDWIQAEKIRADRLEDKLTLANEQLKNTRIRHTRTDRERDSVLRSTLHP